MHSFIIRMCGRFEIVVHIAQSVFSSTHNYFLYYNLMQMVFFELYTYRYVPIQKKDKP